MRLLHAFQTVERVVLAPDLTRKENDIEHSYMLAMFCWYLHDSLGLKLDMYKVFQYSLAHDFVEVYAGDTYAFDHKGKKTKHKREENARLRIAAEFPEFKDMHEAIKRYEDREDPESVFVHAVDKLLPMLTNYLQKGHNWKQMNVQRKDLYALKRETTKNQEQVRRLVEELVTEIEPRWTEFFNF